ncbi:unnamed protein product, partial [Gongylonema pulchrum]|uniref:Erbb2 interacting protein n=1 Tax=Gongylonema pulchrum TaxID=637853 RepID=A0A183DBI0_9BILA
MYLQSPRPFGQHSTSYRSMGNSMRSSTSMTNLQTSNAESGRASAPPADLTVVYEGVGHRRGPFSGLPTNQTPFGSEVTEQTGISQGPGFAGATRKTLMEDRGSGGSTADGAPTLLPNRRIYHMRKTTSLQNAATPTGDFDQNFIGPNSEASAQNVTVVPIHRTVGPNRQPPPWARPVQPSSQEQILRPYH